MELKEKLQALRKQKGLTQEELAAALYVSRTAISKWESGRGYPSIDSLRAIADFFSVSLDELLSGEEMLSVAKAEQKQTRTHFCDLLLGLFDLSVALLLFLPLFGERADGGVRALSLLALTCPLYLKILYFSAVILTVLWGVLMLALQSCEGRVWQAGKNKISLSLSIFSVLLLTVSQQPYAAVFCLVLLAIKVFFLFKRH